MRGWKRYDDIRVHFEVIRKRVDFYPSAGPLVRSARPLRQEKNKNKQTSRQANRITERNSSKGEHVENNIGLPHSFDVSGTSFSRNVTPSNYYYVHGGKKKRITGKGFTAISANLRLLTDRACWQNGTNDGKRLERIVNTLISSTE